MKKGIFLLLVMIACISCKKTVQPVLNDEPLQATSSELPTVKKPGTIPSVTICTQVWMQKNLDVTTYRNGDPIPQVTDPTAWLTSTTGAWCYYNNDPANGAVYGKLYNWYAVNDPRGLAPAGWHIPSDTEWTALSDCLGGASIAGGKLKEKGFKHWIAPNTGATNSSRFTALAAGNLVSIDSRFVNLGLTASYWSSTPYPLSNNSAYYRRLTNNSGSVQSFGGAFFNDGFSIRCMKD